MRDIVAPLIPTKKCPTWAVNLLVESVVDRDIEFDLYVDLSSFEDPMNDPIKGGLTAAVGRPQ